VSEKMREQVRWAATVLLGAAVLPFALAVWLKYCSALLHWIAGY